MAATVKAGINTAVDAAPITAPIDSAGKRSGGAGRPTGREQVFDAVLDSAERLFSEAGPGDVSLRAIAQDAGVNYGLVHRHFGTKDELLEALLHRYTVRWAERMTELDYDGALDELIGAGPETGAYLRVLAWTLLSDRQGGQAHAHSRHATLDELVTLHAGHGGADDAGEPGDITVATAAALALAFGWRFFQPFIADALHLDLNDAELQAAIRRQMHRVARPADPVTSSAGDDRRTG